MNRRRKNNIVIGTLCAVLVLMGVGYAILNTTLNIGGTANIKGDFDIHFTRIQRSSSTITDSTLLSTMDNGTGITDGTNNHEGTFTAVLQKPTDYVIYEVEVANTGSIDGYLTFTFGDKHNNFNYYKDFYSVEFIRDDVTPNIKADILQNGTFTDNEVLENTTGERTYKIKVTFKESATSFPDATTNGAFECTLNLTYSQQAPSGGNSGENTESNLVWYSTVLEEFGGVVVAYGIDESRSDEYVPMYLIEAGEIAPLEKSDSTKFIPYKSSMVINHNYVKITPQDGDYIMLDDSDPNDTYLTAIIRGSNIYMVFSGDENADLFTFDLDPNGSLEKYTNNGGNNQQQDTLNWYATQDGSIALALAENNDGFVVKKYISNGTDMTQYIGEDSFVLNPYNQLITINENFLGVTPETGDYVCTVEESLTMLLRGHIIYMQQNVSSTNPVYTLSLDSTGSLEKYTS